jgi:hypothetical protein
MPHVITQGHLIVIAVVPSGTVLQELSHGDSGDVGIGPVKHPRGKEHLKGRIEGSPSRIKHTQHCNCRDGLGYAGHTKQSVPFHRDFPFTIGIPKSLPVDQLAPFHNRNCATWDGPLPHQVDDETI